ncbi:MAG: sigma-54-dependent Fis family transcriptional regulator [Chromatiaceae bacterium]|nr:sigma-54-dependent Fis family transcriptional regulator [Gammaproteobacteria bacterium]MCP5298181.1 sigma-54-dependent Fis family transcriptional regulator [Chromatiaceae bacterium]MCP5423279.1 sigma-54-dependent Fis family transcriptional regulator [Chromatiaceae bacterium]
MTREETSHNLMFVDDDPKAGELLRRFCAGTPYRCETFRDPIEALAHFTQSGADVVVTDLRMPGMDGLELLARIRELDTEVPVVIVTAYSGLEHAIEALRHGASDFLKKPFDMEELMLVVDKTLERSRLHRENRILRRALQAERKQLSLVGNSPALTHTYSLIERVAGVRCNVIISGESGTGKELAARAIHNLGGNPDAPFVVVDCGALSDTLLESELFGHEKGAFTGASAMKRGLFEVARGGTVFLDEIGNISEAMQIKLLRVIQERQTTRVGGVRPIDIDVRCLVATNADLEEMVREGQFRADLFHRLNVVTITMPPLRDRREDIPELLQYFVDMFAQQYRRDVKGFDAASLRQLENYAWPGNVRELKNLVERHVVLADQPVMQLEGLPERSAPALQVSSDGELRSLAEMEWDYIQHVLAQCEGNRTKAAGILGIDKSTLWRKLQSHTS